MSGRTIIEKIFQQHADESVEPGKIVWIDLDVVSARDFGGPNVVKNYRDAYGQAPVFDEKKIFFTFDLTVPAKTIQYANNQQSCRQFAREHGVGVFDVDRGIGTHTLIEEGLALPGTIVVGTDSHMNVLGAVNCFGQGMGDVDIAFGFRKGRTWFEVPRTVRVEVTGEPEGPYTAKDLTLWLLKSLKTEVLLGRAAEFYGPAVEALSLSGRITLLSMITEMAGIIGFIPFNEKTAKELAEMNNLTEIPADIRADSDASYERIFQIDAGDMDRVISLPPVPHKVEKIHAIGDVPIDFGFIGSCTNGRLEDLESARRILKGKHIAPGVRLAVVPATRQVFMKALERGILKDLFDAGAIISNPGCGGCAQGHIGMTGKGEVMVSTGNRNFVGKQGDGANYLASPETVAHSVLEGRISAGP